MLSQARLKNHQITWMEGSVVSMPFNDSSFDGAISTLATHHFPSLEQSFKEIARVLKTGGRYVIFTITPEQVLGHWLNEYFPVLMQKASDMMTDVNTLASILNAAGFDHIKHEPFYVTEHTQDLFLPAGKYKPAIYLDSVVRNGISAFAIYQNHPEIEEGCRQLQLDIVEDRIQKVILSHEGDIGELTFVVAS